MLEKTKLGKNGPAISKLGFGCMGMSGDYESDRSEFSLFVNEPVKNNVLATCNKLGISFIPFSPLCRGFLTNEKMHPNMQFDEGDFRRDLPMFQGENFRNNLLVRDKLKHFSEMKNCSLSQLALAWLMAQEGNIVPIPGTRSINNFQINLGALAIQLTKEDLAKIAQIMKINSIQGTRYPIEMFKRQNIQTEFSRSESTFEVPVAKL